VQGHGGDTVASMSIAKAKSSSSKRKRTQRGDPADIEGYKGPWAAYEGELDRAEPTEEQRATMESWKSDEQKALEASKAGIVKEKKQTERSTLHIKDAYDYQGRSFLHPPAPPAGVKYGEAPERCFLPKKLIHTWYVTIPPPFPNALLHGAWHPILTRLLHRGLLVVGVLHIAVSLSELNSGSTRHITLTTASPSRAGLGTPRVWRPSDFSLCRRIYCCLLAWTALSSCGRCMAPVVVCAHTSATHVC